MVVQRDSRAGSRDLTQFLCVSLAYVGFVTAVFRVTGHSRFLGDARLFFQSADSQGYRDYAHYLGTFGAAPLPDANVLSLRPFLYPWFLAAYAWLGIGGFQILQILLAAASVALLHRVVRRFTGQALAVTASAMFALTPTVSLITLHALTETFALFLTVVLLNLLSPRCRASPREASFLPLFVMSLLVVVKAVFLPAWLATCVYTATTLLRRCTIELVSRFVASTTPVLLQLALTAVLLGHATLSSAGSQNFEERFFPAVFGQAELGKSLGYRNPRALAARASYPTLAAKLAFVARRPAATITTFADSLVRKNILAKSQFVFTPKPAPKPELAAQRLIASYSLRLNAFFLGLHIMFLIMTPIAAWRSGRSAQVLRAAQLYLFSCSLLLPSALVYFQGDRVVVAAEPVWLLTYALVVQSLVDASRSRKVIRSARPH